MDIGERTRDICQKKSSLSVPALRAGPPRFTPPGESAAPGVRGRRDQRENVQGTLPLGQLNLTTEVENFPSWPEGDTRQYLKSALSEDRRIYWVTADKPSRRMESTAPN